MDDYYEPWTYDYENLFNAPEGDDQPTARADLDDHRQADGQYRSGTQLGRRSGRLARSTPATTSISTN
jgi:hypothetical protein